MKKPEEMLLDAELKLVTDKLSDLQTQLNNLLKVGDGYTENESLPIQFFVRVNGGQLVQSFSNLAKDTFNYVDQMKRAVEENARLQASQQAIIPQPNEGNFPKPEGEFPGV